MPRRPTAQGPAAPPQRQWDEIDRGWRCWGRDDPTPPLGRGDSPAAGTPRLGLVPAQPLAAVGRCRTALAALRLGLADLAQTVRAHCGQAALLLRRLGEAHGRDRAAWSDLLCEARQRAAQLSGAAAGDMLRTALLKQEEQLDALRADKRRLLNLVRQQERRVAEHEDSAQLLRDRQQRGERELDSARSSAARARNDRAAAQRRTGLLMARITQAEEGRREAEERALRAHKELGRAGETARKAVAAELASLREQLRAMRTAVGRRDADLMRLRQELRQLQQQQGGAPAGPPPTAAAAATAGPAVLTTASPSRAARPPRRSRSASPLRTPRPQLPPRRGGVPVVRSDITPAGRMFSKLQRASLKALTELARRSPRAHQRSELSDALARRGGRQPPRLRPRAASAGGRTPPRHGPARHRYGSPSLHTSGGDELSVLLQLPRSSGVQVRRSLSWAGEDVAVGSSPSETDGPAGRALSPRGAL